MACNCQGKSMKSLVGAKVWAFWGENLENNSFNVFSIHDGTNSAVKLFNGYLIYCYSKSLKKTPRHYKATTIFPS
jgi:hypothetical protein